MKKDVTLEDLMEFMKNNLAAKSDLDELSTKVDQVQEALNEHTKDLNIIKNDVKNNLEKRLMLDVRVTNIEKHVGLPTPEQNLV